MNITKIYKRLTKNVNLTNNMIISIIILVALFILLGVYWWYKQTIIEGGFFKKLRKAVPSSVVNTVRQSVPISIPGSVSGLVSGGKKLCKQYCNCRKGITGPCKTYVKHIYRTNKFMKNQCNNCICLFKSKGCSFL